MPINVISTLKPINNAAFPVVEDSDVKGGFQVVTNTTARDSIPVNNRKEGMVVYLTAPREFYKLSGGITDNDWIRWQYANIVPTILGLNGTDGVLRTQHSGQLGYTVYATGCVYDGDGGGGLFEWIVPPGALPTDDGGTIIIPSTQDPDGDGYWKRVDDGPLNVRWFGAQGTYQTEQGQGNNAVFSSTAGFTNAFAAASSQLTAHGIVKKVYIPSGIYYVDAQLTISASSIHLFGDGETSIVWSVVTAGSALSITNITNSSLKDFVIMRPNNATGTPNAISITDAYHSDINVSVAGTWNNILYTAGTLYYSNVKIKHINQNSALPKSWNGASNAIPISAVNGAVIYSYLSSCLFDVDLTGLTGTAFYLKPMASLGGNTIRGIISNCADGFRASGAELINIRDLYCYNNGASATAKGSVDVTSSLPITLTADNNTLLIESNASSTSYNPTTVTIAAGTYTTESQLVTAIQTALNTYVIGNTIVPSLDSIGRIIKFKDNTNTSNYIIIQSSLSGSTFNSVLGLDGFPMLMDLSLDRCKEVTIGPNSNVGYTQLFGSQKCTLISAQGHVYISANSDNTFILNGINGSNLKNNSKSTSFIGSSNNGTLVVPSAQASIDSNNLVLNGDFSRWLSATNPWGYFYNGNITKCGEGLSDDTRSFASKYCAQVINATEGGNYLITNVIPDPDLSLGTVWKQRASIKNWRCIASSSDGKNLVAGVYGGYLFTSTNYGVSWTQRDPVSGGPRNWIACASSADGTKLMAVVYGGSIYQSSDSGVTWVASAAALTLTENWTGCAMSADGTIRVVTIASNQLNVSNDSGTSWGLRDSSRNWSAVSMSSDGNVIVAVVNGGRIYTSVDQGSNFSVSGLTKAWSAVSVSGDGTKVAIAITGDYIYYNNNAIGLQLNWASIAISSDGSNIVAGTSDGRIYTSSNSGSSLIARDSARNWAAVAMSLNGRRIVAGDYGGYIYTSDTLSLTNDLNLGSPITVSAKIKYKAGTNQIYINIRDTTHEGNDIGTEVWRSGLGAQVENGFRLVSLTRNATQAMIDNGVEVAFIANASDTQFYVSEISASVGYGTSQEFIRRELSYDGYTRLSPYGRLIVASSAYPTYGGDPIYNSSWAVNDYIENNAISQLGNLKKYTIKGWKCSVAGSPGTWIPEICYVSDVTERIFSSVQTGGFTISSGEDVLLCDTTGTAFDVLLPASPATGDRYVIQDYGGNASYNHITVNGNGKNIIGHPTYIINESYDSVDLIYNGTFWAVLGNTDSYAKNYIIVNQVSHGFATQDAAYFNGTSWLKAKSNSSATLGLGVVQIIDADNFYLYYSGYMPGLSGLTGGQYYFVSDSVDGLLTTTEPTNLASFSNPLLFALSATSAIVLPFRPASIGVTPVVVSASSAYPATYGNIVVCDSSGGGFNVTLPTAVNNASKRVIVKKMSSDVNTVTVVTSNSETIDTSLTFPIVAQYTAIEVMSDGVNWIII